MDIPTLYIVFAGVLLASAVALIIAWRENPHEAGQRSWALGACAGVVSTAVFSVTSVSDHLFWVNALVNPFAWGAVLLFARGVREYVGLVPTPRWMLWFFVLCTAIPVVAVVLAAYERGVTITVGSVVAALFCFDLTLVLLRPATKKSPASYFLVFFFGLWGVTHIVRAVLTVIDMDHDTYARPIDRIMLFVGVLGAATTAMGFVMLTTRRLRDARARNLEALERSVGDLREQFAALAAGDYSARAEPRGISEHMDVIANLFNETVSQVGLGVGEIERQRRVLAAAQESLLDGLVLVDSNRQIMSLNAALVRLLGCEPQEHLQRPLADLLAPDDRDFADAILESVADGPVRERPTRFRLADGTTATLTVNVSAYRDASGAIEGAVLSVRDDRPLREAQAQLQMADRLAAMGTVAAGVAHEINNPLAFVASNLEFALEELQERDRPLAPEAHEELVAALKAAHVGSDRIAKIVRDLKRFTRSPESAAEQVNVNQLIESAVAMLENEIRHHAVVSLSLGEVPPVRGAEAKLGQVFLNIVHNAAQAIPLGHASENRIRITSLADKRGVVVEVSDTGGGISEDNKRRIFDAFFTTKEVGVGTGLGLAISHRIVSELGGRIEVESTEGEGALFRVVLPAAQQGDALAEDAAAEESVEPVTGRRLLVIDDEPEVGETVRRALRKHHSVDVVTTASAGLARLAESDYDVILCDLMMPEMTGMELYSELLSRSPELAERVVFMTGGVFSSEAEEFLQDHAKRVLAKPFNSETLRRMLVEQGARESS